MMMRAKRPRALHALGAPSRARSLSDESLGDDLLLHMDPSLMTERQQLAFLLRKTAHEQSGGDSPASESSDDELPARRPKKRIQPAKTTPRHAPKASAPTPRARASKPKPRETELEPKSSPKARQRLHVKTSSPPASDADDEPSASASSSSIGAATARKPSPSSTSDVARMGVFDDFWSRHCALCSASASALDVDEPLFLCQACDKKYPTQRALGRV